MLVLKHANNWSFEVTEQQMRANVVCREFARVGLEKVPDAKVLAKIAKLIGPQVVEQITAGSWSWRSRRRRPRAAGCGWIRRWWKPTSTTLHSGPTKAEAPGRMDAFSRRSRWR
jgi:hypothetical protein